jgi:hypothetical protein
LSLTQQQLNILEQHVQAGDRIAYWETLSSYGSQYAELALGVVRHDTSSGATANRYFINEAGEEGVTISNEMLARVGEGLMEADFALRVQEGGRELNVDEIQQYHEQVFGDVANVSANAWTPDYYLNSFDTFTERQVAWENMLNRAAFVTALEVEAQFFPLVPGSEEFEYVFDLEAQGVLGLADANLGRAPFSDYIVNIASGQIVSDNGGDGTLTGGSGNDVLVGLAGDDTLIGVAGSDRLHGASGDDTADYSGESAGIRIEYGDIQDPGQAELWAGLGRGRISQVTDGSGALDTLIDVERLIATDHDDVLSISAQYVPGGLLGGGLRENGINLGGEGEVGDTVDFSAVAGRGVVGSLDDGTAIIGLRDFPVEIMEVQDVEILRGSSSHDDLNEGNGDGQIDGGEGADILDGTGDGRLNGDQGADILIYRDGETELAGGLGNDYYDFTQATGSGAIVTLEEGFGRDVFSSNYGVVDRVVFEGVSSSDVTFTWNYTVQEFNQGFFVSRFLNGEATITVNSTGDSLYLGNVGGQIDFDRFGLLNSFIQSFFEIEFMDGVFRNWNSVFGRPDQISSQAVAPDANTALQDHEDERAQDPETDTETREFDDGRILVSTFVSGSLVSATMTDVADAYVWTSYEDSFDAAGVITDRSWVYDDGRTAETSYTDGVRSMNVITDAADEFVWATLDQTFDAAGVRTEQTNTYDDGRVLETLYVDGVRSTATMTDVADAYVWTSYEDSFDAAGVITDRSWVYDDGRTAETSYTDGVRSMNVITDAADEFVWATLDQTFDAAGVRTEQTNTYDDGRVLETLYVDGVRSTATMTDVADAYQWESYVDSFDAVGDRISRLFTYDDGSELLV